TAGQVVAIVRRLAHGHDNILCPRVEEAIVDALLASGLDCRVHADARLAVIKPRPSEGVGLIVVVSAGTSDVPVAEEAAVTAETMGNRVERVYDRGVGRLHPLGPPPGRPQEAQSPLRLARR